MSLLSVYFAKRYILAANQLGSTRWVTRLSAIAISVVVAAMVCVLSVFAGYVNMILADGQVKTPDLVIKPREGKVVDMNSSQIVSALEQACVATYSAVLVADGIVLAEGREVFTEIYGVNSDYSLVSTFNQAWSNRLDHLEIEAHSAAIPMVAGATMAWQTGLGDMVVDSLKLYLPKRTGFVNPMSPQLAIRSILLHPQGILMPMREDIDQRIFVPITALSNLLDYPSSIASHIELNLKSGYSISEAKIQLGEYLDDKSFVFLDQEEQRPELTWLIRAERWMVYGIMLFILLLAASCLSCSLVMLMLEKRLDLNTLYALGSTLRQRAGIFAMTGLYISLIGVISGLALGLVLCVLQMEFGLLMTGEGMMMMPFPVAIRWQDLVLVATGCALVSLISILLPSIFVRFVLE